MSFRVERSHIVFKHIIHVGPEIDVEAVSDVATRRDYTKNTRQLQTPRGPLQEYLFRPKTNPQSLIVFSRKGFVIDAQPSDNVLPLFRDAYDFYEKAMGDAALTATALMDINSKFEVFSPIPVNEFLNKLYKKEASDIKYAGNELRPQGISLAFGSGKFPEEFIHVTAQPLPKDPAQRLMVVVLYRSTELDDALKFIEKIDADIVKTLQKIAKV
ncbi:MAG: hypothetical protein ACTSQB_05865 [Candidatus Heimdallarchaeota archaeon]